MPPMPAAAPPAVSVEGEETNTSPFGANASTRGVFSSANFRMQNPSGTCRPTTSVPEAQNGSDEVGPPTSLLQAPRSRTRAIGVQLRMGANIGGESRSRNRTGPSALERVHRQQDRAV